MSPTFYIHPKSIKASLGETVVFNCAAQGAFHPNITWLKDGMPFTNTSAKMILENTQESSELRIISVSETDIGKYSCLATNGNVEVSSQEAELSLKGKKIGNDFKIVNGCAVQKHPDFIVKKVMH